MNKWRSAAFFDVDETIITTKSMFDFLRHWCEYGGAGLDYRELSRRLGEMAHQGVHRSEINRAYYRLYTGVPAADLERAGRAWYAEYRLSSDAFVTASLAALVRHQDAGDAVIMVSGSFSACLSPIAEEVRADMVLCTEPVIGPDGRLTGEVVRPMIGNAKADAVRDAMERLGLDPRTCFGYADHSSDLDMLSQVGHPAAVGGDPVLTAHAREHGWPVLPADGRPADEAVTVRT